MNFIQYVKQVWKAGTSGGTPLSPDRLNHMEDGIKNNNSMISELNNNITDVIVVNNADFGEAIKNSRLFEKSTGYKFFACNKATNNPLGDGMIILMHSNNFWNKYPTYIFVKSTTIKTGNLNCTDLTKISIVKS